MTAQTTAYATCNTEADQVRDDLIARTEGLIRQIRRTTTQDIAALERAYDQVVALAHALKTSLDT
jgi:predicted membrane chloride channel (bestrophin family)